MSGSIINPSVLGLRNNVVSTLEDSTNNRTYYLAFIRYTDDRQQIVLYDQAMNYNPSTETLSVPNLATTGSLNATTINITDTDTAGTYYITFVDDVGNTKTLRADKTTTPLTYNPNTSTIGATEFSGNAATSTQTNVIDDTSTNSNLPICFANSTGNTSIRTCSDGILNVNPSTGITSIDLLKCPTIQTVGVISGNSRNISFTNGTINSGFFASDTSTNTDFSVFFGDTSQSDFGFKYDNSNIAYNPSLSTLKVSKLDNCFALTSSGSNLPILFIDQTATGKQFLYNNSTFYYNPTLGEFLLQGNTTTQNINCNNLTATSTDAGATAGPNLILYRNSASPAANDFIGEIQFKGRNDAPADEIYAKINVKLVDASQTAAQSLIETTIMENGSSLLVSRQAATDFELLNGVGLSVAGKGTFIDDVVIEQDLGVNMAGATNPLTPLHVIGTSIAPTSNGLDGIVQIATNTGQNDNKLTLGVVNGDYSWLQAYKYNTSFDYGNLCLNPAGGNVAIGTSLTQWNLRVDEDAHFGDALDNIKYGMVQIVRPANQGTKFHLSFIRSGQIVGGMGFLNNSSVFGIQNGSSNNTTSQGIFISGLNIGINERNPQSPLHITGTAQIRATGGQSNLSIINHLSGIGFNLFTNHSTLHNNFHIQGGGSGGVYLSAGATAWAAISDDRLKHNEVIITNGLDVIMKLEPVFYDRSSTMMDANFNGDLDEKYYQESGFIAQQVYTIDELKHLVDVGDEERPWAILYQQLIAYNTAATQQLKKEKDELQNKVTELENELNLIKQHLNLT